jgi:phytoene dehydrogenase-like protein
MTKSIIIIGSGLGGLSAGIYGQMNGFNTHIYEMHSRAGGQCASWQRSGYTFDACIHHLMGCSPKSKINKIWSEIGAMQIEWVYPEECVSVVSPDGRMFNDYYDLEKLEKHLCELSPSDTDVIHEYINAIRYFSRHDMMGAMVMEGIPGIIKNMPAILKNLKWFKMSMADFAKRFSDPFLQKAFPLLVYSSPSVPMFMHLMRHGSGYNRDIAWPVGASNSFIDAIVRRYKALGGRLDYSRKVTKILVKNGKAVGVRLEDGTEELADIVISNADGRKTLLEMLDGKYLDDRLRGYCAEPADETNWAVHVFLGVNRDLSMEPSSIVLLLDEPVTIAGHECTSLEMQIYGFDKSMAPEGQGTIKVELVSSYSYWKKLSENKQEYNAEKKKVAEQIIDILENHFHGIRSQVEEIDVPTLLTWERFMGGTHGFINTPSKKMDIMGSIFNNSDMTVPRLENFYFVGVWATSAGATFLNALSGQKAIKLICKKEHLRLRKPTI